MLLELCQQNVFTRGLWRQAMLARPKPLQDLVIGVGEKRVRIAAQNRFENMQCAVSVIKENAQALCEACRIACKPIEMREIGWIKAAVLEQAHSSIQTPRA